jgi:hypothetical protein
MPRGCHRRLPLVVPHHDLQVTVLAPGPEHLARLIDIDGRTHHPLRREPTPATPDPRERHAAGVHPVGSAHAHHLPSIRDVRRPGSDALRRDASHPPPVPHDRRDLVVEDILGWHTCEDLASVVDRPSPQQRLPARAQELPHSDRPPIRRSRGRSGADFT